MDSNVILINRTETWPNEPIQKAVYIHIKLEGKLIMISCKKSKVVKVNMPALNNNLFTTQNRAGRILDDTNKSRKVTGKFKKF